MASSLLGFLAAIGCIISSSLATTNEAPIQDAPVVDTLQGPMRGIYEAANNGRAMGAPVVDTLQGPVRGIYEAANNGRTFASYYGIPYAKPPVGGLRFMPPVPGDAWEGILDGGHLKSACPQINMEVLWGWSSPTPDKVHGDEDCLHLNVFTHKAGDDQANLPVMIFIHAGAYIFGSVKLNPPYVMMNKDIVFVSIQYRLGSLGFLSTEDEVVTGNMGLKDQTLAISWVKDNIKAFGGNPEQITIFGGSSGSSSVHLQILTPHSRGLFQRAIMQSGNALCPWAMGDAHLSIAKMLAEDSGCSTSDGTQAMVSCLQKAPVNQLLFNPYRHNMNIAKLFATGFYIPMLWGPRVDGDYLPAAPEILLKEGRFKGIDIIAGVTKHEGAQLVGEFFWKPDGLSIINDNFNTLAPVTLELRKEETNPAGIARDIFDYYIGFGEKVSHDNAEKVIKLYSDRWYVVSHEIVSQFTLNHKPDNSLFLYQFDYRGSRSHATFPNGVGEHWVSHVDDLFYLFEGGDVLNDVFEQKPMTEDDLKVREQMTTMWYNFANTGDPTPDKSLGFVWSPTNHNLKYLSIGPNMSMQQEDTSREKIRSFWFSLPTRQNYLLHPDNITDIKQIKDEL